MISARPTSTAPVPAGPSPAPQSVRRPRFIDVLRAERIKLVTLRSTVVLLIVVAVMIPLVSVPASLALLVPPANPNAPILTSVEPLRFVDSVLWLQLVFAVVAVLAATSEYASGEFRLSVLAMPARVPLLLAKAVNLALIGAVIGVVSTLVALCVPLAILPAGDIGYDLDPGTALTLAVVAGLYLALSGVVALALGSLIRNQVVALLVPIAIFTIVPSMLESIGNDAITTMAGYFPTMAGRVLLTPLTNPAGVTGWLGLAVLAAWALGLLAAAGWALRVRDA